MLKNWVKTFKNVKNQAKNHSRMSKNREKCRKPKKTVKNFEKPVKKPSKISKNRQKC